MKTLFIILLLCTGTAFAQNVAAEKKAAQDAALAFLKWYKTGWKGFDQYKLYSSAKPKSDGPPYTINWKNVDKHFAWIKANALLFAAAFIKNEKKYFEYSNQMFKKYPTEEMPSGFDYERVLGSQEEVGITLKSYWLNKAMVWKVKMLNKAKAEIAVLEKGASDDGSSYRFLMIKENGSWKVALPPGMFGVPPFEKETNM